MTRDTAPDILPLEDRAALVASGYADTIVGLPHGELVAVALINKLLAAMQESERRQFVRQLVEVVLRRGVPGMSHG